MALIDQTQLQIGVQRAGVWTYSLVATDPANEFAMACKRNAGQPVSLYTYKQQEICTMIASQTLVLDMQQIEDTGVTREDIITALRIANVYIKGVIRING